MALRKPLSQKRYVIPLIIILSCCGCFAYTFIDVSLHVIGVLPTYTPSPTLILTSTATLTPTLISTPTETFTPTITPTPTLTAGEILDEAIAIACQGNYAISSAEAGSSTDQPGARLCPGFDKIMLPEEWVANTLGSLRYIVNIETGLIPTQNCMYESGFMMQAQQVYQKITVYNSTTGTVVKQKNVSGPPNSYCPSVFIAGGSNDFTGDYPPLAEVENAMIALLRSLLPALK